MNGSCRFCALFRYHSETYNKKKSLCVWTGKNLRKDHVEPFCRGFHYQQHGEEACATT